MTLRRPRFGLAAKFSFLVSLPVLIASLALGYSFMKTAQTQIERGVRARASSMARSLARASEYGILVEDKRILAEVMKFIDEEDVLYKLIRNTSGEVLSSYGDLTKSIPASTITDDPTMDEQKTGLSYCMAEIGFMQHVICDVVTIRSMRSREDIGLLQLDPLSGLGSGKAEKIGTVQIGLSRAAIMKSMRKAKLGVVWLTSAVIVVAIISTVVLIRIMVKPIKRLAIATGEVSRGNFDYPVAIKSKDEIGELAGSFNTMIADLRSSREALQRQLEVEERFARELAEKAKELSQSNAELDAFVYTVSHDLKAPVVSLQGFSSLLMKDYEDSLDDIGKMYIERIQRNSEHMGILIDDLLELSRIGRIKGKEELVNVSGVIPDVTIDLASQLEERGTRLIVKDEMPTIQCDRTRVSQIFANLISNANKFMGEDNTDPTIEVGYDGQDSCHTFYVRDNGIGIDEEYHGKIFQMFQRLEDIQTEGTGVGLAIVKKIVENWGGKIWVDSAKGKGTIMYFTVPKADKEGTG